MNEEAKPRGRKPRTWVKLDCSGVLHGSINWQLSLEEQAIWIKMFAYAAVSGGRPGTIQDNDGKPLPHWYIAHELHCPEELFETCLGKCVAEGRCRENGDGIVITNFEHYQFSEYDRQKPYRDARKAEKEVFKLCHSCGWTGKTNQAACPDCGEALSRDYSMGKYAHLAKK